MINNFEIIKPLLSFEDPDDFYFLQILKRRKDNPGMTGDSIVIDNHFIFSNDYLDRVGDRIRQQCIDNNARAYIRLNRRNARKVGLQCLKKVTDYIINEDFKAIKNAYQSSCGEYHSDPVKKWIIDIDEKNEELEREILDFIDIAEPKGNKFITKISTRIGTHLITTPFRIDSFKKQFSSIDIHKDNPTILFIP